MTMSIFDESGKSGKTFARPIKNQESFLKDRQLGPITMAKVTSLINNRMKICVPEYNK